MFRLGTFALLTLFAHPLLGGVVLDGSFGTKGALPGPNFMITAPMGKLVNTNLFQSFSQFNLNSSQSATFAGPSNVQNILARVTSGSPSSIDGRISSQIPGANLFFMNPAGVLFGQHAQLDVSGSFAVTTANYLKLVGGGRFNANLGGQDTLTSAPVSSFGFLNQAPAPISITGSNNTRDSHGNIVPGPGLSIAPQKSFSIVAGDIAMNASTITGHGSRVNLVSVKSPGEVQLDATNINSAVDVSQFKALGTINLTNLALIDTTGPGGGPVTIRGGNLNLNNSQVSSETTGAIQGGAIDVALVDKLEIANLGSIVADTVSGGKGGNLSIHAGSLSIHGTATPGAFTGIGATSGGVATTSNAGATGDAGKLTISVDDALSVVNGGQISSSTFSSGNGGNLNIQAGSLSIHGVIHGNGTPYPSGRPYPFTGIIANTGGTTGATNPGATGNGGNVTITVDNALSIVSGGQITASTFSEGDAGDIKIHAGSISMNSSADISGNRTGIDSRSEVGATGDAGNVTITVDGALNIAAGSGINTATFTSGQGGDLTIQAGSLSIDSTATPDLLTGISAAANVGSTRNPGNAGDLTITVAGALSIVGGNAPNVTAHIFDGTRGAGNGGNLIINAGSLSIDGTGLPHAGISVGTIGSGDAGTLTITVNNALSIVNGGQISSSTSVNPAIPSSLSGKGDGGNIRVTADSLLIDGANSGIFAEAGLGSSGKAGNMTITVDDALNIVAGGVISASTSGTGTGGTVSVTAESLLIEGLNSQLSSATSGGGNAGDVEVNTGKLKIKNQGTIAATTSAAGNAGSITVHARDIKMKGGSIASSSTSSGAAGSIKVTSEGTIRLWDQSAITVSAPAPLTNGGDISIKAPVLLSLINSKIDATAGNIGGNITIDPIALQLKNSKISASAGEQGGHIDLFTSFLVGPVKTVTSDGSLLLAFNSSITATGGTANGTVNVTAPALDLGAELITLPTSVLSAENQLQERCTALLQGDFSSFISIGRGGTEPAPEELQTTF